MPVTGRLDGTRESAEQAVNTPNEEERLEQMSHPKNQGDGTDDAPRKVEWTCLGLYGMAMERSCSLWRRREFWDHSVPPNTTRSTRLSLCGCDLTTSISSPQGKLWKQGRERTNRRTCPGNHPRSTPQKPMFRTSVVTCSRSHQGMDPDGLENGGSPQKKSPKKPINRMCLGEESTDESSHSQATVRHRHHRPKDRGIFQGSPRWGFQHETGC